MKQKAPIPQLSAEQGANSCSRRSLGGVSLGKPIIGGRTFVAIGANVCCSGGGRSTSISHCQAEPTNRIRPDTAFRIMYIMFITLRGWLARILPRPSALLWHGA
ncbi:hypothetical protein E5C33_10840 [Stenotrophomonas maltophilia]|nr:hypothetical protein E5C33_10840 [Stenotrophomonas maltophilia]